jgi:hypothetical protein
MSCSNVEVVYAGISVNLLTKILVIVGLKIEAYYMQEENVTVRSICRYISLTRYAHENGFSLTYAHGVA